ncbi:transcription termination factor MTERF15, mitochondrial-like [Rhododendron vialii]|uniref:transcription termination factor MTERF15, mitochondrial-like n=1 Tax=Rhododendron vialii TaxID=182163 RepID=UPI00265F9063|nr:transcription termination factor MTERF15, mitochondrial-like [Rhododendron vialii]
MLSALLNVKRVPIQKIVIYSTPLLVFLRTRPLFLRPISSVPLCSLAISRGTDLSPATLTKSTLPKGDSYVVSYLIDSCGLSPENAISASKKLEFETPERPDSVLDLLRTYGFTETQISKLVGKRPRLLVADPEKILLPKLEFFQTLDVSRSDLARILSGSPIIFGRSLENHIIPSYNFLKSVLQSDKKVLSAMKHTSWNVSADYTTFGVPNLAILREFEVPESSIGFLLAHHPEAILKKHEQFKEIVNMVKEMGFEPSKLSFVLAVHAFSGKGNNSIWDRCFESYGKWGWSKDEIFSAFKKQPHCMVLSEKKITRVMDFLVNKMGWHSKDIARYPTTMLFSLEKRIVPRCLVIQVLVSKGLVKKDLSLGSIISRREECFLERFVIRYEKEVPQLLSVYERKVDVLEL